MRTSGHSTARCFDLVTDRTDGSPVTYARFTCGKCAATADRKVPNSKAAHPLMLDKAMTRDGWFINIHRRGKHRCPACLAEPDAGAETPPPKPEIAPMATPSVVRELTPDQRLAIRNLLDKHFDDKEGCYLEGETDAKLAESLGIPRVHVERVREAAYGPIRVSAEVVAMRGELAGLRAEMTLLRERVLALPVEMAALEARLDGLIGGMASKAA